MPDSKKTTKKIKKQEELIGIDHGNSQIKTVHCVFPTALKTYMVNPGVGNILEYDNICYSLSSEDLSIQTDKTEDESFFILTLIAIAEELLARQKAHDLDFNRAVDVRLAVGLPPGYFNKKSRDKFNAYFLQDKHPVFTYKNVQFNINIKDVKTLFQGFSAIAAYSDKLQPPDDFFIVDIGGYTTDVLEVRDGVVQIDSMISYNNGIKTLDASLEKALFNATQMTITSKDTHPVFMHQASDLAPNIQSAILKFQEHYISNLINQIKAERPRIKNVTVYFVGGGSMICHDGIEDKISSAQFIDDISANAKGYEVEYRDLYL